MISIRSMSITDLDKVYDIEASNQPVPWSFGIFEDCLEAGYEAWVLEINKAIEGYILIYVKAGECHILNICVRTEHRGKGLGKKLLQHALKYARKKKADIVLLEVRPTNIKALKLYQHLGFNEIGLRKGYYAAPNGGREDALILALDL